jgi:hypothetical protein
MLLCATVGVETARPRAVSPRGVTDANMPSCCSVDRREDGLAVGSGVIDCVGRHHGGHSREIERLPYLPEEEDQSEETAPDYLLFGFQLTPSPVV